MNRTGIALLSAAALLAAGSVSAGEMDGGSDISWTYAQVGYIKADGSDFDEIDGFGVGGSLALSKNWHVGASYIGLSEDSNSIFDVDSDSWGISGGYNAGLTKNSQAYVDLGFIDTDLDGIGLDGGEGDAQAITLSAGLRYKPAPKVELGASVNYTDGEIDGGSASDLSYNDTSFGISGQYFFTPMFSLGAAAGFNAGVGSSSSTDVFTIFLRGSFGGPISDVSDSSDASY